MDSDYWCYRCEVTIVPLLSGAEIQCPRCNGGWVEQIQGSPRQQRPASPFADRSTMVALFSTSGGSGRRGREEDQESGAGRPRVLVVGRPPVIELLQALGSAMAGLEISGDAEGESREEGSGGGGGGGGSSGVVVVDPSGVPLMVLHSGGPAGGSGGNGAALGDYFIGPGLEALIQRLAENDPNRYGTPPASKTAVEALPVVKISENDLRHDFSSECAVCKEDFEVGEETRQLPCKHLYHHGCIMPWLKMHSSCPVCRFQMPTEDEGSCGGSSQSEESTSAGENARNSGEGNGGSGGSSNRSSPISQPFSLIRSLLSSALGSGNNNSNSSNNNEEDQGPRGSP